MRLRIQVYQAVMHEKVLKQWLKARETLVDFSDDLPRLGWIVNDDHHFIACGFLRLMEGGYSILEGMATNPECSSELRHEAMTELVNHIIQASQELNAHKIIAHTVRGDILKRAESLGFMKQPHMLLTLDLTKKKGSE